jgi:hypothetical protein
MTAPVFAGETHNVGVWDHSPSPTFPRAALATHDEGQILLMPVYSSTREPNVLHVINAKVSLLRGLQNGWLGDGSVAIDPEAINNFREFLRELGAGVVLRAEPVGNADGGVEIEWTTDDAARRVIEFTSDSLWLFENRNGVFHEVTVPFNARRAVEFFGGEPI